MRRAGIARASTPSAVPNTVIMARPAKLHLVAHTFALCRVSLDARFPSRRQDAAFSPRRESRDPIQASRTLSRLSQGISIIRRRPTRPASLRSQHRHAQSHNCPGVPDFEDFFLPVILPKIDELNAIDERSYLVKRLIF